ncbi:MAG: hypothetical protein ACYS76_12100 [Planctomycetota bacterium]
MKSLTSEPLKCNIKNWWWLAAAVLLTMLLLVSSVAAIIQNTNYTMLERLHSSLYAVALLTLWGLSLQRRILEKAFWRLFFFFNLIVDVVFVIFEERYALPFLWCVISYVTFGIVHLPCYIGMFIYAFRSREIWGAAEHRTRLTYPDYQHFRWARRKQWLRNRLGLLKCFGASALVVCCLTFVPLIIRNNRVIYPEGMPPEWYGHVLEYRRTTIPELQEFERLFPNYLCDFDYSESKLIIDPNGTGENIAYVDPNSPVKWRLSAGWHKRYLFVMEIDIVFGQIDRKTGAVISPGSHNEPTFSLWEVRSVSAPLVMFSERGARASRDQIETFGLDEWRSLVEAKGDFTALGVELKHNDPIPDFELAFRNNY